MKRTFWLCILTMLIFENFGVAQITLNSNNFPVAGFKAGRGYAATLPTAIGTAGGSQFFDLTEITPVWHDSVKYYSAAQTPWGAQHPGTTVCNVEPMGDLTYIYFYTEAATAFIRTGVTVIGDFGAGLDTVHGNYTLSDTLLSTAYTFGHTEMENSLVIIPNLVPFADFTQRTRKTISVDAWGWMQTPLNTYNNVLRVKVKEYRYDTVSYFGTPVYVNGDSLYYYKFYAENVRFPVLTAYTDSSFNMLYLDYLFTAPVICGCTDTLAQNYNPLANQSDGSCIYCNVAYSISSDTIVCPGATLTLTAGGGSSYLWNDGTTAASIIVAPTQTTTFSVYVSNGPDCHALAAVTVTVDEPVTASFWTIHPVYNTLDEVQFVNLTANALWYNWTLDDTIDGSSILESPSHSYATAGVKHITLLAGNSCFTDQVNDSIEIMYSASIAENTADDYSVYPNPGSDYFVITGNTIEKDDAAVWLIDLSGRKTLLSRADNVSGKWQYRADTRALDAGLYFIEVRINHRSSFIKWVKTY